MAETGKKLSELTDAFRKDISVLVDDAASYVKDKATKVGDTALDYAGGLVGKVESEGGVGTLSSKLVKGAARKVGEAVGTVGATGEAVLKTLTTGRSEEPFRGAATPAEVKQRVDEMWQGYKAAFQKEYDSTSIKKESVASFFEKVAGIGVGAIGQLYATILQDKDRLSAKVRSQVPSREDYVVQVGKSQFQISDSVRTKSQLRKVALYVNDVAGKLPHGLKCRNAYLAGIAAEGIRSDAKFREKMPDAYKKVERYLKR